MKLPGAKGERGAWDVTGDRGDGSVIAGSGKGVRCANVTSEDPEIVSAGDSRCICVGAGLLIAAQVNSRTTLQRGGARHIKVNVNVMIGLKINSPRLAGPYFNRVHVLELGVAIDDGACACPQRQR